MSEIKQILIVAIILISYHLPIFAAGKADFDKTQVPIVAVGKANFDEAQVPEYKMLDPLIMVDGTIVKDTAAWRKRRVEIQKLFEQNVYGKTPETNPVRFEVFEENASALNGTAIRRQIRAHFTDNPAGPGMDILVYLPVNASAPVPIFVGLNFHGNQTVYNDPGIRISRGYNRNNEKHGVINNRSTEKSRGQYADRWAIDLALSRGYGVATIHYGEIEPDHRNGFAESVRALYPQPAKDGWAAIGAWAWGLSRAVDYFETDKQIDAKRVIVIGHSRLGKTSLWAGACDERFAMVIGNNSGCGGAALSKREFGEKVNRINTNFPQFFCDNFTQYNDNESALPLDQHMLLAMVAPRALYVASAVEDRWADPHGEFLAAKWASPVYKLLGTSGLPATEMPQVDMPSHGRIGYHVRTGKHAITEYDWKQYLDFADKNVK